MRRLRRHGVADRVDRSSVARASAAPVDILTSGPWSEPLLLGQPGVGEVYSVRSRKTPYWLRPISARAVRRIARARRRSNLVLRR